MDAVILASAIVGLMLAWVATSLSRVVVELRHIVIKLDELAKSK